MNILVVEDNINLADSLEDILEVNKYHVDVVYDGEDGLYYGENDIYDIIIMDVMLPKLDGLAVVKELRKRNISKPIIMLTAKTEIDDKIKGLDCGADDYMTKPFSSKELLARIRALSRRKSDIVIDELVFEDIRINLSNCEIYCGDKKTKLSHTEFELLKLLINNKNITLSKEDIIIKVWGYDSDTEENNVEAYISFVRKKLKFLTSKVGIKTIRKIGYIIEVISV